MLLDNSDGRDLAVRELKKSCDGKPCKGNKICQDGVCTRLPKTEKGKRRPSCYLFAVDEIVSPFVYILMSF